MNPLLLTALALAACWIYKTREQRRRIALLAAFLGRHRIEKNMEAVTQGYLRALGEQDPQRQQQVFAVLRGNEEELAGQLQQLASDFASLDVVQAQVSLLPMWIPFANALFPSFDMRKALALHARGVRRAVSAGPEVAARDRAFVLSAEVFLLQHTCHWFCRSKLVASARMLAAHKTSYEQLVGAVSPQTRQDYLELVRRPAPPAPGR